MAQCRGADCKFGVGRVSLVSQEDFSRDLECLLHRPVSAVYVLQCQSSAFGSSRVCTRKKFQGPYGGGGAGALTRRVGLGRRKPPRHSANDPRKPAPQRRFPKRLSPTLTGSRIRTARRRRRTNRTTAAGGAGAAPLLAARTGLIARRLALEWVSKRVAALVLVRRV